MEFHNSNCMVYEKGLNAPTPGSKILTKTCVKVSNYILLIEMYNQLLQNTLIQSLQNTFILFNHFPISYNPLYLLSQLNHHPFSLIEYVLHPSISMPSNRRFSLDSLVKSSLLRASRYHLLPLPSPLYPSPLLRCVWQLV